MTAQSRPVFRFAPSPTGRLHLGHARSALLNWRWAARTGGRFLLRIEDIDTTRGRDDLVEGIFEDLGWLGVAWELPVWRQSERFAIYQAAWRRLEDEGLLYPCFASRSEILSVADPAQRDPDGAPRYPGLWRGRAPSDVAAAKARGLPMALRLDMGRAIEAAARRLGAGDGGGGGLAFTSVDPDGRRRTLACDPARWGDVVLVRKEVPTSYHLAVVIDDAAQGVTHVVRGADLEAATDLHRLLQVLLGLPAPLYHHHGLVLGPDGRKLSKSAGATALKDLRDAGVGADVVARRALDGLGL